MKALVLSGGGSLGAYQVGALQHLLGEKRNHYPILTGVSVGAINAAFLAQFHEGEEAKAAQELRKIWDGIKKNKHVRKHWIPLMWIHGLWKEGLYNTKPLRELIECHLDVGKVKSSGKLLRIGATSLNSARYELWTEQDDDIVDGIMASSAFPILFNAAQARGELWVDGGIRNVTPLSEAISLGATEIDVILPDAEEVPPREVKNTLGVAVRSLEIMISEITENDLKICELINAQVKAGVADPKYKYVKLNLLRPGKELGYDGMDFSEKNIQRGINIGYHDAVKKSEQ